MSQKGIIQYTNLLCSTSITSLEQLANGQMFCQLVSLISPHKLDKSKIQPIDTWMQKLMNLKLAVKCLLEQYEQEFIGNVTNKPPLDFDLLKIAKNYDHKEIVKLFEGILYVFLNCQNKEGFIKKIMQMGEQSQHYMMDTVRKLIDTSDEESYNNVDPETSQKTKLLDKLGQLEHQIEILKSQNVALQQQATSEHNENTRLNKQLNKLSQTVTSLNMQLSNQQPSNTNTTSASNKYKTTTLFDNSSLIQSLKQKLITESVEHEREKMRFSEEIELMRVKLEKIDEMETRVDNYQQRNTQLNQRVQELEEDIQHDKQDLKRKTMLIEKLQEKSRIYQQRINKQELDKITMQVDVQKLNVRSERRVSAVQPHSQNNRSDPYLEYEAKRQSQEELAISNRRIKTLEKQLAKTSLKAEKAGKLEVEKKELEETFVIEMNNRKQEVELLSSALVEVRRMFEDFGVSKGQ